MAAKARRRVASSANGSGRRRNRTSPLAILGAGQNTDADTVPAGWAVAYQASFTLGTPYIRDPGAAQSRSATSFCTMTSPRSMLG